MRSFKFNNALIRQYMYGTGVLEYGIQYYQTENPKLTREQAAENAYQYAEHYCRRKCVFDRSKAEDCMLRTYSRFAEKVKQGRYFCTEQRRQELES